jgi:hypothetical protein
MRYRIIYTIFLVGGLALHWFARKLCIYLIWDGKENVTVTRPWDYDFYVFAACIMSAIGATLLCADLIITEIKRRR